MYKLRTVKFRLYIVKLIEHTNYLIFITNIVFFHVLESMSGSKLNLAKSSVLNLIQALDDSHFITLINFDGETQPFFSSESDLIDEMFDFNEFRNDSLDGSLNITHSNEQFMLPCNNETYESISQFFDNLTTTEGSIANLTKAIESAIDMDDLGWATKRIPENALSMFILLTDGRSASGNNSEVVGKEIRMVNKAVKIPIFTIGVGFDANMEFLENVAGEYNENSKKH